MSAARRRSHLAMIFDTGVGNQVAAQVSPCAGRRIADRSDLYISRSVTISNRSIYRRVIGDGMAVGT